MFREAGTKTYSPNTQISLLPTMKGGAIIFSHTDCSPFTPVQMFCLSHDSAIPLLKYFVNESVGENHSLSTWGRNRIGVVLSVLKRLYDSP